MTVPTAALSRLKCLALVSICCLLVAGCATVADNSMQPSANSLQLRQLQTRRVEGIDEKTLLAACVGVLQDLGFNIDESEARLGVIVASKSRSAVEPAHVAGDVLADALLEAAFEALFAAVIGDDADDDDWDEDEGEDIVYDVTQEIRASVVTRPALDSSGQPRSDAQVIRITIQRLVWNSEGEISHSESIEDPEAYQKFFDRLSKSIFLELQAN
jgi:hypothetical protein